MNQCNRKSISKMFISSQFLYPNLCLLQPTHSAQNKILINQKTMDNIQLILKHHSSDMIDSNKKRLQRMAASEQNHPTSH